MSEGIVLDPTAKKVVDDRDPGPDFGDIRGKTIGFRVDTLWRAWDWVVEVWANRFKEMGAAKIIYWRTHQGRTGSEGERLAAEEKVFMRDADVVISGLGNCGSCTGWSIRDAMSARDHDKPAIAVMTEPFRQLSESIVRRAGVSGLRRFILPHPLNEMPKEKVESIANEKFDDFLAAVGAKVSTKEREIA